VQRSLLRLAATLSKEDQMPTPQELEAKKVEADAAAAKLKAEADVKSKEDADAKAAVDAKATEGLVKMKKGGQIIHVHPTTVHDHNTVGWHAA
jgi:hypothetical protein